MAIIHGKTSAGDAEILVGAHGGMVVEGVASGTPVPVSGMVTASGPLTDTQLRATAVPVVPTGSTPTAATPTQIIKTVAATATPEALAADNSFFVTALLGGFKAARTANVGVVYLGIGATNDTQPFALNSGEWLDINAPVGQKYDFNDWYCDVLNAGDGVAVIYS